MGRPPSGASGLEDRSGAKDEEARGRRVCIEGLGRGRVRLQVAETH